MVRASVCVSVCVCGGGGGGNADGTNSSVNHGYFDKTSFKIVHSVSCL